MGFLVHFISSSMLNPCVGKELKAQNKLFDFPISTFVGGPWDRKGRTLGKSCFGLPGAFSKAPS